MSRLTLTGFTRLPYIMDGISVTPKIGTETLLTPTQRSDRLRRGENYAWLGYSTSARRDDSQGEMIDKDKAGRENTRKVSFLFYFYYS